MPIHKNSTFSDILQLFFKKYYFNYYFSVMNDINLGDNIRRLRKEMGWTQIDLAEKLNSTQSLVAAYENNRKYPSHKRLKLLAELFDVGLDELVGEKPLKKREVSKNPKLLKKFEQLQKLSAADQRAVFKMIDGLLERKRKSTKN